MGHSPGAPTHSASTAALLWSQSMWNDHLQTTTCHRKIILHITSIKRTRSAKSMHIYCWRSQA